MSREKVELKYTLEGPFTVEEPLEELYSKAASGAYQYLLAYADDGVIWGICKDKKLILSCDEGTFPEYSPKLRAETLWEVRLFGEKAEWLLWRAEDGFHAREITDGQGKAGVAYSESHILWGTDLVDSKKPFILVREADTGIRHTPPFTWNGRHQLRLLMRHYLDYDPQGAAFIKLSRLVDLSNTGGDQ